MADAASTVAGTDSDRASFTIALSAARDQVILAAGVTAGPVIDLAGAIGADEDRMLIVVQRLAEL